MFPDSLAQLAPITRLNLVAVFRSCFLLPLMAVPWSIDSSAYWALDWFLPVTLGFVFLNRLRVLVKISLLMQNFP